ncbi:MAG: hypothetical protein A3F09_01380 [Chlamydiae bacterium RIFCSPHIGHO2_12_FULL_49_11]|nr:MAG: hypothetical protein A3F09_01380 [Chlamydiae bacterium RIFCSPHIGHO2_12_FULL_49_11]
MLLKCPALFYSLVLVIGFGLRYTYLALLLLPLLRYGNMKTVLIVGLFLAVGYIRSAPPTPPTSGEIAGIFYPSQVVHHHQKKCVKGILHANGNSFPVIATGIGHLSTLPYSVAVDGMIRSEKHSTFLSVDTTGKKSRFPSLAGLRYRTATRFFRYLERHIPDPATLRFSFAILTGERTDPLLDTLFRKVGLSHILAISGLHFAVAIGLLYLLLSKFVPRISLVVLTLIFSFLYLLLIGDMPSVRRAFIFSTIYIVSFLVYKKAHPLNTLGAALSIEFVLFPGTILSVGFWLSYLATFAILILFPLFMKLAARLTRIDIPRLSTVQKAGWAVYTFFLQSALLTSAVLILIVPLTLHIFGEFPLLSFPYNIFLTPFFPPLFGLLLLSLAFPFLWPVYNALAHLLLIPIFYPPKLLGKVAIAPLLPIEFIYIYISLAIITSIYFFERMERI